MSISDRYLVIQQATGDGVILVLDADDDFRRVVNVSHLTPSLVTILTLSLKINGNENTQSSGFPLTLVILCIMLSLMFLISVAVLLLIVLVLLRMKHNMRVCHRGKKLLNKY